MNGSPRTTILLFVSQVDTLTVRALTYGRSLSSDCFEAVHIASDETGLPRLRDDWAALGADIPLVVIRAADEEFLRPALGYIQSLRPGPDHAVIVLLPELVFSRWYENVLHNQTAARLKTALRALPWVVVATVPFVPMDPPSQAIESE